MLSSQQLFNRPENNDSDADLFSDIERRKGRRRMEDMKQSSTKKETEVGERIKSLTSQQSAIDN